MILPCIEVIKRCVNVFLRVLPLVLVPIFLNVDLMVALII